MDAVKARNRAVYEAASYEAAIAAIDAMECLPEEPEKLFAKRKTDLRAQAKRRWLPDQVARNPNKGQRRSGSQAAAAACARAQQAACDIERLLTDEGYRNEHRQQLLADKQAQRDKLAARLEKTKAEIIRLEASLFNLHALRRDQEAACRVLEDALEMLRR